MHQLPSTHYTGSALTSVQYVDGLIARPLVVYVQVAIEGQADDLLSIRVRPGISNLLVIHALSYRRPALHHRLLLHVPDPDGPICSAGTDKLGVSRPGQREYSAFVSILLKRPEEVAS